MSEKKILRCAIYTRKSTEEGLDMDYNTLDAQREAGEKYVEAMRGEGWRIIPELYDDGGYSGGNMDRPALKRLMDDIKGGRIDIVVVYKVDRLSRSLTDFAKLVEIFDAHNTSFVSVTQHFNTKDSMGRLTLNILLSFAQFEREVTGERIRDKFAASKKKGMWMGGPPPLGYDVADRKLVTNPQEAKLVCHIFERFIALGSVALLAAELNKDGYTTKSYVSRTKNQVGGRPFTINPLISMLKNRLYVGDVHHKGQYYPGQHAALISHDVFAQAQAIFNENKHEKRQRTWTIKSKALLKGIICCGSCGGAMSPTHTRKKNKHYHYYVANSYRKQMCDDCPVNRIPAGEIEAIIVSQMKAIFTSPQILVEIWRKIRAGNESYSEADLHDNLRRLSHHGSSFIALRDVTGVTPVVGAEWDLLAAGTDQLLQEGDILIHDGNTPVRLARGTDTQILQLINGRPAWRTQAVDPSRRVAKLAKVNGHGSTGVRSYLMADGTIKACGMGTNFSNGDPTSSHVYLPSRISPLDCDKQFVEVFSGGMQHYALTESGEVWSWGYNNYGQLGHGDTANRAQPKRIEYFVTNNIQIAKVIASRPNYYDHASVLFLTTDGKVYGCGYNNFGQLGNGTTANQLMPVRCGSLTNIICVALSGMPHHAYAVESNGNLWVWEHH